MVRWASHRTSSTSSLSSGLEGSLINTVMIYIIIIILATFAQSAIGDTEPSYNTQCRHASDNYAYGSVAALVPLGGHSDGTRCGLLVISADKVTYCLEQINTREMIPNTRLNAYSEEGHVCPEVAQAVRKLLDNGLSRDNWNNFNWMMALNRTIYYGVQNIIQEEALPDTVHTLNHRYIPSRATKSHIRHWLDELMSASQVEVGLMIQNGDVASADTFPGLLIVLEDSQYTRVFKYKQYTLELAEVVSHQVGLSGYKVKDLYMQHRKYQDRISVLLFFDKYYGRVRVKIGEKNSYTQLEPFPILPVQSLFNCPVHLCWWPLVNDILYYEGTFYFFQNRWLFALAEGDKDGIQKVEDVIDLDRYKVGRLYGAYVDYEQGGKVMIVQLDERRKQYHLTQLNIERVKGKLTLTTVRTNVIIEMRDIRWEVLTAVMYKDSGDRHKLWLAMRDDDDVIRLRGFDYNAAGSRYKLINDETIEQFRSISAIFYHPQLNRVFVLSNAFVYTYETLQNINLMLSKARCSVNHFGSFFNCSPKYYDQMPVDDIVLTAPTSKEQYLDNIRLHYKNKKLLPAQCNWMPEMTVNSIEFVDKIVLPDSDEDDDEDDEWTLFTWEHFLVALAVVAGVALTIGCFYVILVIFQRRKRGSRASAIRKEREQKLKEFMKYRKYNRNNNESKDKSKSASSSSKSAISQNNNSSVKCDNNNNKRSSAIASKDDNSAAASKASTFEVTTSRNGDKQSKANKINKDRQQGSRLATSKASAIPSDVYRM